MNFRYGKANTEPTPKMLLRPAEAAKVCGVSERTFDNWLKIDGFPSIRIYGCRLIPVEPLRKWIDKQVENQGGADDE